jgi:hypothetical protein
MWDDSIGLYFDKLVTPQGTAIPVLARSMVGVIPAMAVAVIDEDTVDQSLRLGKRFAAFQAQAAAPMRGTPGDRRMLLSVTGLERLEALAARLFDEQEFLAPYGLRALSAYHREHPYELDAEGVRATIDYEPAESTTPLFGGNSNWRGPIWFPLNYLAISSLEHYHRFFGAELTLEYPTGSGTRVTLDVIARDLQDRLISIFVPGPDGRRPCFGWVDQFWHDPRWQDHLLFNEYFHGDNAAGLGASHQTGWTALIADIIRRRHGAVPSLGDVLADGSDPGQ